MSSIVSYHPLAGSEISEQYDLPTDIRTDTFLLHAQNVSDCSFWDPDPNEKTDSLLTDLQKRRKICCVFLTDECSRLINRSWC